MLLRNVFVGEPERIIRAIAIDNPPLYTDDTVSFGTMIEALLTIYLSQFTENKRVYKVEDAGALVGYYIIDYDSQGNPSLVSQKFRKVYVDQSAVLSQQILLWAAQETPTKILP